MKTLLITVIVSMSLAGIGSAAEADRRLNHQQKRIAEGIEAGQLTPHQTAKLERHDAAIQREVARDRAKNDGTLTAKERAKVNRQENATSRAIYRDRHN